MTLSTLDQILIGRLTKLQKEYFVYHDWGYIYINLSSIVLSPKIPGSHSLAYFIYIVAALVMAKNVLVLLKLLHKKNAYEQYYFQVFFFDGFQILEYEKQEKNL